MSNYILHKDGAYQLYSTVSDGPVFEQAITQEQLRAYLRAQWGQVAIDELPERLERAHVKGTSSHIDDSLADCIWCNRAGPYETEMSLDDFIAQYLTLPVPVEKSTMHEPKWKPASTPPPTCYGDEYARQESEPVLGYFGDGMAVVIYFEGRHGGRWRTDCGHENDVTAFVTYWTELPEPPGYD